MRVFFALLLVGTLLDGAWGLEIPGKVAEFKGDLVQIKTDAQQPTRVGDRVEIFFEIPGLDEKALVATGKVVKVNKEGVLVKIERVPGKLAVGQHASILSEDQSKKAKPADARELQVYRDEIDALNEKLYQEAMALFADLQTGQLQKLKQAEAKCRKALNQIQAEFTALKVPNAPAARKVQAAEQKLLKFANDAMGKGLPEIYKLFGDTGLDSKDRLARLGKVMERAAAGGDLVFQDLYQALKGLGIPKTPDPITRVQLEAWRTTNANNLKQIGLALIVYHDVFKHFPVNIQKNGKPLLSWRVAILPSIGQDKLYKEFKLDEPWDGPHNRALLEKMPITYLLPGTSRKGTTVTHYQGFSGKGTMFETGQKLKFTDIKDGSSNTLAVVEAGKAVPWTKPEDISFAAGKPVPSLGALFANGFGACFCDGSVRLLPTDLNEKTLRGYVTRDGGESVPFSRDVELKKPLLPPGWPKPKQKSSKEKSGVPIPFGQDIGLVHAEGLEGPGEDGSDIDPEPRLKLGMLNPPTDFGVTIVKDSAGKPVNKRLTYSTEGTQNSNSTVLRIDGKDQVLGGTGGKWLEKPVKVGNGFKSVWSAGGIEVRQTVEIVPGKQPVEIARGVHKRLLDTVVVRYELINKTGQPRKAGLRLQLDTMIGANDGVPFAVPGLDGVVQTQADFKVPKIPDFIQALENGNLQNPGTVAHLTLKLGDLESPNRVSITHWPGWNAHAWDVPMKNINEGTKDSCVVMYWDAEKVMAPGARRLLGFAYGLGSVSSSAGGDLRITVDGQFRAGKALHVLAYVNRSRPGQSLTLKLPPEIERLEGKEVEKVSLPRAGSETSTVTWRVRPTKAGKFTIAVVSSSGLKQSQDVVIEASKDNTGIAKKNEVPALVGLTAAQAKSKVVGNGLVIRFEGSPEKPPTKAKQFTVTSQNPAAGSKVERGSTVTAQIYPAFVPESTLALALAGPKEVGKILTLTASVANPEAGQTLTLETPAGLALAEGSPTQAVPVQGNEKGLARVEWKLKAAQFGEYRLRVLSSTGMEQSRTVLIAAAAPKTPVKPKTGLTMLDAQRALKMAVKLMPMDLEYDLDGDGRVTSADAVLIMRRALDAK